MATAFPHQAPSRLPTTSPRAPTRHSGATPSSSTASLTTCARRGSSPAWQHSTSTPLASD